MKVLLIAGCFLLTSLASAKQPKTEDEKILYALGLALARNVEQFKLDKKEAAMVMSGFDTGVNGGKKAVDLQTYGPKIRSWHQKRQEKIAAVVKKEGKAFLDKIAKDKKSKKLPSGVVYQVMKEGKGAMPKATDKVKVHYHGTLIDGTVFDSSVERKSPATFAFTPMGKSTWR